MIEEQVEIPANTLIHVGGVPFLTVQPVRAVGTPKNLAIALAVAGSASKDGTDAQQKG